MHSSFDRKYIDVLIKNMVYTWGQLFTEDIHIHFYKPLELEVLWCPAHKVTCRILFIYSMETFVYSALNTATRTQDESKVLTLGPLAQALTQILMGAEQHRASDPESFVPGTYTSLYRGLKLTKDQVGEYKQHNGKLINLCGFNSTSLDRE